jgi:hypothetical protein
VVVPSGYTCALGAANVGGNVTVEPGGRLHISGSIVGGNVTSTNAGTNTAPSPFSPFSVLICNSKIGGNVTITGSASKVTVGGQNCAGNLVGGNVVLTGNRVVALIGNSPNSQGRSCSLNVRCRIGGNVTVSNNKFAHVTFNKIDGDLTCRDNVCGIEEHDNVVGGVRRGQCVGGL